MEHAGATAQHFGIEQHAFVAAVLAGEDLVHAFEHVIARDVGQETEPPLVHADERHFVTGQPAGCRQQRSVSAEHDREVRMAANLVESRNAELRRSAGRTRSRLLDQHLDPALAQEAAELQHRLGHFRALVFADQRNRLEAFLHGAH